MYQIVFQAIFTVATHSTEEKFSEKISKVFLPCTLSHVINGKYVPSNQSSKPRQIIHGLQEQGLPPQGDAKGIPESW